VADFDVPGVLRRIRRSADLSQRDLADRCGVSHSVIAHAECGKRDLPTNLLERAAGLAGLRLAVLDRNGVEVTGMTADGARDRGHRRFPAHLDTRHSDEGWWHGPERYSRPPPWFTFDRERQKRDARRRATGTPEDHHVPQPGDSPAERKAARVRAARERKREELERRRAAGELPELPTFTCCCPPGCDDVDDWSGKPVHAPECACGCDVG
jgi:transcriptional regulator with XRE-family HTH domain